MRRLSLLLFATTLFCSTLAPAAASPDATKPLTARDLIAIQVPGSLDVARDGARVAFVVDLPDFERSRVNRDLFVARLGDAPGAARRLTHTPEADELSPRFSPDGSMLAFLANRKIPTPDGEASDDEEPKQQVWVMPTDGGEARPLTSAEEGVFDYGWMPDGRAIVYTARELLPKPENERKAEEKKQKRDATVVDEERYRREFWTIEVESGKARRVARGDYGVEEIRVSPDGRQVVYETNLTGRDDDAKLFDLWVLSIADGATRQLTTRVGADRQPRWSPDGRHVAFVGNVDGRYEYSRVDLFVVPAAGGEPRNVSAPLDRSVERISWLPDSRHLLATVVDGVHQPVYRFDMQAKESPERVTSQPLTALEAVPAGKRVVAVVETPTAAPEVWTIDGGKSAAITDFNAELRDRAVARQEAVRWKAPDGLEIEGVLVYPLGYKSGTRVPLLVEVHGGPFGRADMSLRGYYFHPQMWAAEGYAVLLPNFRGSDGYGEAFGTANRRDLAGKDFQDVMAGVDHVIAMGVADPARLGIMGLSYGGYMTNWAISQTDRFKGAISEAGIFNLITDYSNSIYPSWERDYLESFYWENLDLYLERSPARYADRIKTPVLIVHGDEDTNTFISNSKEMYQALKALGRKVQFVRYPREPHGFEEPNHRLDTAARWLAWMNEHVRGGPRVRYGVGDFAPAGSWEYAVASVDAEPAYAGRAAAGRYVEVALLLRGEAGKSQPFDMSVRDVAMVLADGRELRPIGVVTAAAGARAIVEGDARIRVDAREAGERNYLPVVLAFDVPKEATTARLRLGAHAPITLDLPPAE